MSRETKKPLRSPDSNRGVFLVDLPWQMDLLLKMRAGTQPQEDTSELVEFARSFLRVLAEDQAIIPQTDIATPKLLASVLIHHLLNPESCVAWLNLGLSLRLVAKSDPDPVAATRLQKAIYCFERSLAVAENDRPVQIRAWVGKAFVLAEFQQFEKSVQCSRHALDLDRSDPNLWLLHSSFVERAGKTDEALELVDEAYKVYVMAGRPPGLRYIFDVVVPPANTPDPTSHLRRVQ